MINLDFNTRLFGKRENDGSVVFPVFLLIKKISYIHARSPRRKWSLCLTLNSSVDWEDLVCQWAQQVLRDNFNGTFLRDINSFIGQEIVRHINNLAINCRALSSVESQRFLMTFVPKAIASHLSDQQWYILKCGNFRYGGGESAPMVSFLLDFDWRSNDTPQQVYRANLEQILAKPQRLNEDGQKVIDRAGEQQ